MTGFPETDLADALRQHYEICVASVELVAGGEDIDASVYQVTAARPKARYLVKVRMGAANEAANAVPRYLNESGIAHVAAPIPSRTGALSVQAAGHSLTVYPFIDGRTGTEAGLSEQHWRALGDLMRRLHTDALPPQLLELLATETYRRAEIGTVRRIDDAVSTRRFADPLQAEVAGFWVTQRDRIHEVASRMEKLGRRLEQLALPLVTCHADLHTWNMLIDADDELRIVDWDEVVRAPRERDLMFVVGGIHVGLVAPQETAWFFEGYGDVAIDPVALSFYRCAWAVQDIASFGERLFLSTAADESRPNAARLLQGLFNEGGIVGLALCSDDPATCSS
jgi:spectinomycin phosphotransferase